MLFIFRVRGTRLAEEEREKDREGDDGGGWKRERGQRRGNEREKRIRKMRRVVSKKKKNLNRISFLLSPFLTVELHAAVMMILTTGRDFASDKRNKFCLTCNGTYIAYHTFMSYIMFFVLEKK